MRAVRFFIPQYQEIFWLPRGADRHKDSRPLDDVTPRSLNHLGSENIRDRCSFQPIKSGSTFRIASLDVLKLSLQTSNHTAVDKTARSSPECIQNPTE